MRNEGNASVTPPVDAEQGEARTRERRGDDVSPAGRQGDQGRGEVAESGGHFAGQGGGRIVAHCTGFCTACGAVGICG